MNKLPILFIIRVVENIFSLAAGFIGAFLLFAILPLEGNFKLLVVQSGSMEPAVPLGSLVLVVPKNEYLPGDIVTFTPSDKDKDKYVTHRLAEYATETFGLVYKTKGDANKTADQALVPIEQILGKVFLTIPHIGTLAHRLQTPLGFILVVIVPATIVVYEELKKVYQGLGEGVKKYLQKKQVQKLTLTQDDRSFLQNIENLRRESEVRLDPRIVLFLLFFGLSFTFARMTNSFFSDTESATATFVAGIASSSPAPGSSPSPAPAHIVINEVFYDVDSAHGLDSPGDRGVTVGGHVTQIRIEDNGAGSQNSAFVDIETLCAVVQTNQTDMDIVLDLSGDSGNDTAFGNLLGNTNIESGDVANSVVIDIQGGSNTLSRFCGGALGRNHEWIELYNPTSQTVNLKNWTITDNSGIAVKITGNRNLGPGDFALISKSNSTWAFWSEPGGTLKIPLGRQIGDGLDDDGDHLFLQDDNGNYVDAMSYGDDTSQFGLLGVNEGHALERNPDGLDTDTAGDWIDKSPPAPGT